MACAHRNARRLGAVGVQHAVVGHRCALEHGVLPIGSLTKGAWIFQSWQNRQSSRGTAFIHERCVLFGVQKRHVLPGLLNADVAVVGQGGLAASRSLFGGDQHNTVRTSRTINGGGRRVLQDADALNVRRVQVVDASRGNAVDNEQRV